MDKILDKILSKKFGIVFFAVWLLNGLAEKYESHSVLLIWMMYSLSLVYLIWQAWWDYINYSKRGISDDQK